MLITQNLDNMILFNTMGRYFRTIRIDSNCSTFTGIANFVPVDRYNPIPFLKLVSTKAEGQNSTRWEYEIIFIGKEPYGILEIDAEEYDDLWAKGKQAELLQGRIELRPNRDVQINRIVRDALYAQVPGEMTVSTVRNLTQIIDKAIIDSDYGKI